MFCIGLQVYVLSVYSRVFFLRLCTRTHALTLITLLRPDTVTAPTGRGTDWGTVVEVVCSLSEVSVGICVCMCEIFVRRGLCHALVAQRGLWEMMGVISYQAGMSWV